MDTACELIGDVNVLTPPERLDVATAPGLSSAVEKVFDTTGKKVLVDLTGVGYVSSLGLASCLKAAKLAQARGGRLVLSGLSDVVREVFDTTGIGRIIAIYPTRESALESFARVFPQPPKGSIGPDKTTFILPEEILLLALKDEGGKFVDLPERALDFALAAAVLMELCLQRRIDSDLEHLIVVDQAPLGDDILDPALKAVADAHKSWSAEPWVRMFAREGTELRRLVVDRLVKRGILQRKDNLLHWMTGGRRYPMIDDSEPREVKARILGVLKEGEVPDPRDVALIALADACAVFDAILGMDEMLDIRPRITEIAHMDLFAQAMNRALGSMQSLGQPTGEDGPDTTLYGQPLHAAED